MRFCILLLMFIFGVNADTTDFKHDPIVQAINRFSTKIENKIGMNDNIVYSPFYIYIAVAVGQRADGNTKTEINEVLELGDVDFQTGEHYRDLGRHLSKLNDRLNEYDLRVANGVFIKQSSPAIEKFKYDSERYYGTDVMNINFNGSDSAQVINSWVSLKTNNMIPKLLELNLNFMTSAVLLNAVYFKGFWETQFSETMKFNFFNGIKKKVIDIMCIRNQNFFYFDDFITGVKYLKIPYKGQHIAMLFVLPYSLEAPANFSMSPDLLYHINTHLVQTAMRAVLIPRFKFEHTVEMKDVLIDLGIKDFFYEGVANLTITENNDVFVSSVLHKVSIEVDEAGTKLSTPGVNISETDPDFYTFRANHPFNFYITDEKNGMILFAGKVSDP